MTKKLANEQPGQAKSSTAATAEPILVAVTYDLSDLPTAQHKAGLAGLIMGCLAKTAAERPGVPAVLAAFTGRGVAPAAAVAVTAVPAPAAGDGPPTQTHAPEAPVVSTQTAQQVYSALMFAALMMGSCADSCDP